MVVGLDKFREFFKDFTDSYIIIGGAACDIILEEAELVPRVTGDIDLILIVEALKPDFGKKFWEFVKEGKYKQRERSEKKEFYRFLKPEDKSFPFQIELFAREPDLINLKESIFTPIPLGEDISSLSAILLNEDYYNYTVNHSTINNGAHIANIESLICLKARAFIDLSERKAKGEKIDKNKIVKHKTDIFRLAAMLTPDNEFELPKTIKDDLQKFANMVKGILPDKNMFKKLGIPEMNVTELFKQFLNNFKLNID